MSIMLQKGGQLNLTKSTENATRFLVGLGWDISEAKNLTGEFDLDVSISCLSYNEALGRNTLANESNFVFYNTPKIGGKIQSPCGGVIHHGDNKTGQGEGDDETLEIDFSKLSSNIVELAIIVSIHEGKERRQHFGLTRNSYIRVVDSSKSTEVCKYTLSDNYAGATALHIGSLVRVGDSLEFKAVGAGFEANLNDIYASFCA